MIHQRFFVNFSLKEKSKIFLADKDLIHQIAKVLRLKINDQIILLDDTGFEYLVNLEKIGQQIQGYVLEKRKNKNEPEKKIILCQSLLKSDKFEQVLKFCANLGVVSFVPFISENSIVKEINPHKLDRYQKIIRESAEQSGRAILPELNPLLTFKELLSFLKDKNNLLSQVPNSFIRNSQHSHKIRKFASCQREAQVLKLIGWEQEKKKKLTDFREQIKKAKEIYLLIGPEGGFTEAEVALAEKNGFLSFSLGKLILRAEIAGVVASSLIFSYNKTL